MVKITNHEPPSISFYPSNVDGVVRYHPKKVMFQDFLMQTSPVIPHSKIKNTFITYR